MFSKFGLQKSEMKAISGGDIRKYRDEKCYTQAYMANELGIGQSAYQKIESGEVKISMERLVLIASILNKPLEAFLKSEDHVKPNSPLIEETVVVSKREWSLMQKVILQQEQRIEELEEKLKAIKMNNNSVK
jgi:transcriptional regulator with XRE-family HTH domain